MRRWASAIASVAAVLQLIVVAGFVTGFNPAAMWNTVWGGELVAAYDTVSWWAVIPWAIAEGIAAAVIIVVIIVKRVAAHEPGDGLESLTGGVIDIADLPLLLFFATPYAILFPGASMVQGLAYLGTQILATLV